MWTSQEIVSLKQARTDLWVRSVCLSFVFLLASATATLGVSVGCLLLISSLALVMALLAVRRGPRSREYHVGLVAEGAVACAVLLLGTTASDMYIIYLAAPAFLAGLRGGLRTGAWVVAGELVAAAASQVQLAETRPGLEFVWAPWLFMALAVSLLGAWIRQLDLLQYDTSSSPYASAHHLLGQLRTVTRELSGGLDIEVVSENVLSTAISALGGNRAALLLRGELGDVTVVAFRGEEAFTASLPDDPLIRQVLSTHRAQQQPEAHGRASHRFRACLPLLVGTRVIGVVVVDGPESVPAADLSLAQATLDDDAVRLESAVLFSDVRALATVEERRRLAREIHDGIAQEIASLGYLVDDLARDQCNQRHQDGLNDLRNELTRVVTELRWSIFDLRSGVSSNDGLGSVLGDYVRAVGKSS
ncbi:MAG: histidine kinase, partial [Nocardioidaceae bacterium]